MTTLPDVLDQDLLTVGAFNEGTIKEYLNVFTIVEAAAFLKIEGSEKFDPDNYVYISDKMLSRLRDKQGSSVTISNWTGGRQAIGNKIILFDAKGDFKIRISYSNTRIAIGNGAWGYWEIRCGDKTRCVIGDETTANGCRIYAHNSDVFIGKGCMMSEEITLQSTDYHAIFDCETREILNTGKSHIQIGDHVWLARKATVLPNVSIGSGSIVGACSVVTADVPPTTLMVGAPARPLKSGVTWSRTFGEIDADADAFLRDHAR